jgi:protein TonB
MKPEKILQSNLLDILFENRNKAYGAYELRSHYNQRITKAMGITVLLVLSFGLMQSFNVPHKKGRVVFETKDVLLANAPTIPEKEKEVPKEKPAIKQPKEVATVQFTKPIIVDKPVEAVADLKKLDEAVISTATKDGPKIGPTDIEPLTPKSLGTSTTGEVKPVEPEAAPEPFVIAEKMPEFPGGRDALIKFLQKNLRQPDDFEEGQKMTVVAQFVVNAEGNIVDIQIIKNGRKDLDAEVTRVIRKMPNWIPGRQNGRNVPVFFKVPVTFMAAE